MVEKFIQAEPVSDEDAPADPLIGKVLNDRFRITERLGAGGMGTVYKAVQTPLDRLVALKVLNTHYGAGKDPGFQKRFFLEAAVTSKLRHPNTITVIDYGKANETLFYIAMEYVEGETLAQLIARQGALRWPRALHIAMQVCRSLREAHKAGVVHRDLKPANVMVLHEENDSDLVKVLDFGLVKSFQAEHAALADTELTQAGVFLGSPQYMAPEQARNQAGPRSDIYSLGVVLYQMLMGEPPFRGAQSIDVIVKHINAPPPPMRSRKPELDIPPEVEAVVMKCLEKDPNKRFQTMDELLEGLRRAGQAGGASGPFSSTSGSGPNSGINSGLNNAVGSGPHSGLHTPPPLPRRPSDSGVQNALRPTPTPAPQKTQPIRRSRLVPILLFVAALAAGTGIFLFVATRGETALPVEVTAPPAPTPATTPAPAAARKPAKKPEPAAPEPKPEPAPVVAAVEPAQPAKPASVKFRVTSSPAGAVVTAGGRRVGVTPAEFELPAGDDGRARAEIGLALDGYVPVEVTADGTGAELVEVSRKLTKKKASGPTPKPQSPSSPGYKDDPYQ